jgi:hypothetical protein
MGVAISAHLAERGVQLDLGELLKGGAVSRQRWKDGMD